MIPHLASITAVLGICLLPSICSTANSQEPRDTFPEVPGAEAIVYKHIDDIELRLHVFKPDGSTADDERPAVVFYFGGGWRSGSPRQFETHAQYLASHGIVACCAEYRVHSRHQSTAADSVADAKSAMRYLRSHAAELGIDPDRIAAGGGSAGGHLAAAVALLPDFNEAGEDLEVSCIPDALALFNPAVDVTAEGLGRDPEGERHQELLARLGAEPAALSPTDFVSGGAPPTIIFHGIADSTVPYAQVEVFEQRMKAAGNECELVGYADKEHGFFNHGRDDNEAYRDTLRRTHLFFRDLGWIDSAPTLSDDE